MYAGEKSIDRMHTGKRKVNNIQRKFIRQTNVIYISCTNSCINIYIYIYIYIVITDNVCAIELCTISANFRQSYKNMHILFKTTGLLMSYVVSILSTVYLIVNIYSLMFNDYFSLSTKCSLKCLMLFRQNAVSTS